MHGLIFDGVEVVKFVRDLQDPVLLGPGDAIVAVERAGICGSDLHQYHGREDVAAGTIPGHEFVGEIVEAGREVTQFIRGDRVFSPFTTCCGHCFFCQNHLSSRCVSWQLFGYQPPQGVDDGGRGIQGAQAQFVRVPQADATLVKLPGFLTVEDAMLMGDNFATGYFCADQAAIRPDGITVVLGCGSVGLCAVTSARFLGADTVVAVDAVESRRHRAEQLGAETVTPEKAQSLVENLASKTGRVGADSVLEAVGSPAAQQLAFQLIRPGGTISAVGVHTEQHFSFSPEDAYNKNVSYRAGRCPVRSYLPTLIPAVADGRLTIPTEQIVTEASCPMIDGERAYQRFSSREADCVKILLDPSGE